MVYEAKTWLLLQYLLLAACCMQHCVHGIVTPSSQVPCLYIFGDSLSDNGNNNVLPTSAKANYTPYGIDFPTGPTGRFTNGLTTIDVIAQLLGFENFIPPFANTTGFDILRGVNYASGSAGILNESGKNLGANIPLGEQLVNHGIIISRIAAKLGGFPEAIKYLNKCLYYVNIGSNDYINNYFLPQSSTSRMYNTEQYAELLVNRLSQYLQDLHGVGASKFALVGLGLIGCTPHEIATRGNNVSCAEDENVDALIFSHKLRNLVVQHNNQYHDSKYIFINSTAGTVDSSLGFTVLDAPCCPVRSDDGMCVPGSTPCPNRNEYVFYDGFHPTSALNFITGSVSYNSTPSPGTTYPMDIQQLAQLVI